MANYGDLIHAALATAIANYSFPRITYPTSKGPRTTDTMNTVKARTIKIDQRSSSFNVPTRNRQARYVERSTWIWVVEVNFNDAVSFEEFEDFIAENPPRIPRSDSGLPRQVDIFLQEAEEYVHPPRKSPSTGSRARWRFVAELTSS